MNVKLTNLWRAYPGGARVNNIILKIDIKLFVFYSPVTLNIKSNVPKKNSKGSVYTENINIQSWLITQHEAMY